MEYIKDILDQIQSWQIVLGVYGLCILWIVYEFLSAPTMPEDYDLPIKEKTKLKNKTWFGPNDRMRDLVHDKDKFEDDYENQPFAD